ncbi:MAG TPA: flagellar biosynthesis anti-sigma factor FlgM [Phycisphaerales bacterium]|nr:flagellar biosynthesis anti-sigma factor FlgM [Phycisphaerales bacterium]
MPDHLCDTPLDGRNWPDSIADEALPGIDDAMMEQILENIHHTPMGRVLRRIASLPEVRQQKVLDVRKRLTTGDYDLDEGLDTAIDRVLENLTA